MNIHFCSTPFGRFAIAGNSEAVTHLFFETDPLPASYACEPVPVLAEAARELHAYLAGELRGFSVPLDPLGTPYMRSVWNLLRAIPYGRTASYRDIAALAGNPLAARAVGLANNKNPIPIFIPCHRVVGSSGRLTGYRGGLPLKERLLELERRHGQPPSAIS